MRVPPRVDRRAAAGARLVAPMQRFGAAQLGDGSAVSCHGGVVPRRRRSVALFALPLLLLLAACGPRPLAAQASALRAVGASKNDGRLIVGGLGISGQSTFLTQFTPLFSGYLNATLGAALNKSFVTVYLDFTTTYTAIANAQLDFVYTNPSIFACLEAQYGTNALASVQTLRPSPTPPYSKTPQSRFGANFFTLANRSDINTIADIAGKRLEGVDVTGLGAGQAQWREVVSRGMSFWNLPAVMIFSHSQAKITNDVFTGYADVGMVRTDLLEGLQNPSCVVSASTPYCYPAGTFKILEPQSFPGFQFNSTTVLYPEWPVAALPHVDVATQKAVAQALFAMDYRNDTSNFTKAAAVATFTPPLPYSSLRDMHRQLGWIVNGSCLTSIDTYDTIVCSAGTFRKSKAVVNASCAALNVTCKAGYDCLCGPCGAVPATELSVYVAGVAAACAKLATCAEVPQRAGTAVTLRDNWFGDARVALGAPPLASVDFKFHGTSAGADEPWLPAQQSAQDGSAWALALSTAERGFFLLEARANGVALPDSPFVISVVEPVCTGTNEVADAAGFCVCSTGFTRRGGECADSFNVAAVIGGCVGGGTLFIGTIVALVWWMHARNEAIWRIPLSAIQFAEPPEILGRGTFGLVVKGTYRGTTVALKRTLPPDTSAPPDIDGSMLSAGTVSLRKRSSRGSHGSRGSTSSASKLAQLAQFDLTIVQEEDSVKSPRGSKRASAIGRGSMVAMETVEVVLAHPMTLAPDSPPPATRQDALAIAAAAPSNGSVRLTQSDSGSFGSSHGLFAFLRSRRRAAALRADFVREMRLVVHLRHPNITTVLGAVLERGTDPILVMECMGRGSLYDLLHNETVVLDSEIILPIISDVVSGLDFLHAASPPVLHNDLKSANILVDDSFRAKVSDFGLSGKARSSGGQPGTPLWMAPELLRRESGPTTATDVYAFGITLAEVFSRSDPYAGMDGARVLAEVAHGRGAGQPPRRPAIGPAVPPLCADLMRRCWADSPADRPSMNVIAEELKRAMAGDGAATVTSALMQARTRHTGERALLHEVFPPAVAEQLAAGRRVEPQHFPLVTIFFSDIVSFTDICAAMSPEKVMAMLDRLYRKFDALVYEHGLRKIETIGDAYMCVGNLNDGQELDHAARVAAFALDAVRAAATVPIDVSDPSSGFVAVRAGFHCGPVVASVVGRASPRYCLFGDTVNTASRMESNSLSGRVNLSAAAAALVREQAPEAVLLSRGPVAIKGKGNLQCFWLDDAPRRQPWRQQPRFSTYAPSP